MVGLAVVKPFYQVAFEREEGEREGGFFFEVVLYGTNIMVAEGTLWLHTGRQDRAIVTYDFYALEEAAREWLANWLHNEARKAQQ